MKNQGNGSTPAEITSLLKAWRRGDEDALRRLTPLVYDHLRAQARRYMRHERPGGTLQGTALVHEAYLRLIEARDVDWQDWSHFYAVASQTMRRILVDAARARGAAKRGGWAVRNLGASTTPTQSRPRMPEQRQTSSRWTRRSRPWQSWILEERGSWSCGSLAGCRSTRPPSSCTSLPKA